MNKSVKKKWLATLRAEGIKITRGSLRNVRSNAMCPLGILCDLYIKANPKKAKWILIDNKWKILMIESQESRIYFPPYSVLEWAGLDGYSLMLKSGEAHISYLNDTLKYSRFKIADLIEEQL